MYRLLLVSPNSDALRPIRDELAQAGYRVQESPPNKEALLDACSARPPEVVFWDVQEEIATLRRFLDAIPTEGNNPLPLVIALVPAADWPLLKDLEDADDFLPVPARSGEASVRLSFLLRKRRGVEPDQLLSFEGVTVDLANYTVRREEEALELTFKEYELLRFLVTHRGRVFTRDTLLQQVWGYDFYGGARTVDVHIRRLRAKLGPSHEHLIETVRNVGYRFGMQ